MENTGFTCFYKETKKQTNKQKTKEKEATYNHSAGGSGLFRIPKQNGDLGRAGAQKGLQVLLASHKERPAAGQSWNYQPQFGDNIGIVMGHRMGINGNNKQSLIWACNGILYIYI